MKHLLTLLITIFSNQFISAQPGSLDYSYGDSGKVISETYEGITNTSLLQTDGKILVAGSGGYYKNGNEVIAGFRICRYNQNGELDFSFGDSGRSVNNLGDPGYIKVLMLWHCRQMVK